MNPAWVAAAVTIVIALLGVAANWGMLRESNRNMGTKFDAFNEKITDLKTDLSKEIDDSEERLNRRVDENRKDMDSHKEAVWPRVGTLERNVERIKGKLGMNGGVN
jgi:gas vesicle protein